MSFPLEGDGVRWLALLFGALFGVLLHKGRVTNYNVIVNQFRLRDFTVLKVMLTAIVVGGIGVWALNGLGLATWHIRPAAMLALTLGGALFGIGMVLYGYCPGTGVAAIATGSIHALVGAIGMVAGSALFAATYGWVQANILGVADLGRLRLSDFFGLPPGVIYLLLGGVAAVVFYVLERRVREVRSP